MEKTEKKQKKGKLPRMNIRVSPAVFNRLEAAMPSLKQEARERGEKMSQQLFVEMAVEHHLDYLEGKGNEMVLIIEEVMATGNERSQRALHNALAQILEESRATATAKRQPKQVS